MSKKSNSGWPSHEFRAMGCQFKLWLEVDARLADRLFARAEALVIDIEHKLSRFEPVSELNRLNERPGQWVNISLTLWDALWMAKHMAIETGGLYNPALLDAVEYAGYGVSFEMLTEVWQSESEPEPTLSVVPGLWQAIRLRKNPPSVWLPEGARLDLGGTGKGFAAQRVVELFKDYGPCLVDAGGDLSAGEAPAGFEGWPVAIRVPLSGLYTTGQDVIGLWLAQESLATSGIDRRRWKHNGQEKHHIIDPRTGNPAQTDLINASVLVPNAVEAEALATAALVAGLSGGTGLLNRAGKAAVLVEPDGQIHLVGNLLSRAVWQLPVLRQWKPELERNVYHAIINN